MAGRVGGQEHKAEARGRESEGDKLSRRCVTKKTEAENLCEVTGMSGDRCTPASGLCITCRTGGGGGGGGVGVVVVGILGGGGDLYFAKGNGQSLPITGE